VKQPKWLKYSAVDYIHQLLLTEYGGPAGVRDQPFLQSALDRLQKKFTYESDCTVHDLAAAYAFGIARNHPFVDGNKRTAFVCSALFLELNCFSLNAAEIDAVIIMESLAAGTIDESELARWFQLNSVAL